MEFSLSGDTPVKDLSSPNYYAGPASYLQKANTTFYNVQTGEQFNLSTEEIESFSERTRAKLIDNKIKQFDLTVYDVTESKNAIIGSSATVFRAPEYDNDNKIIPTTGSGKRIANANYFHINPMFGDTSIKKPVANNNIRTCGPTSAQILLGYNNYYNHRKIIPDNFLYGYDDESNTVTSPELNPNYCYDPGEMTRKTIGTRSEKEDAKSFYIALVTSIMKAGEIRTKPNELRKGIEEYLKDHLKSDEYTINEYGCGDRTYLPRMIDALNTEIDANRPFIISTSATFGGPPHYSVGYGYQYYTYPNGEGTYFGYVVHLGKKSDADEEKISRNVWLNSEWCDGSITLKINHNHDYFYIKEIGTNSGRYEYKCRSCGHRTDNAIVIEQSVRYTEVIVNLPQNKCEYKNCLTDCKYKDYLIWFPEEQVYTFQTFGSADTLMTLYDSEYNKLRDDDDAGYGYNSYITYRPKPYIPYIIRVELSPGTVEGTIKLGIYAPNYSDTPYENIEQIPLNTLLHWAVGEYQVMPVRFTPTADATYKIRIIGPDTYDTYMYLIDPTPTAKCLYNDDFEGSLQAGIQTDLKAGVSYLIILSMYDTCEVGDFELLVEKL